MRILYVEDNATNVILVQRVANMGKHDVINFDDGQAALDKFDQTKPDLVLLDVQLRGGLTGLDIARILREKGCTLPIIAVTAYAMKGDRQRCLDAGCDDYLAKPVSVAELVTVFKRYGDAVVSGKPIVSTYKLPSVVEAAPVNPSAAAPVPEAAPVNVPVPRPVVQEAAPVNAPVPQPVVEVSPAPIAAPVEAARSDDSVPSAAPAPAVVPTIAVTVVDPPTVTPQPEPLVNKVPTPVSAEP